MNISHLESTSPQTSSRTGARPTGATTPTTTAAEGSSPSPSEITDSVEISDRLDLRIGEEMLMSHMGKKIQAMFEEHGIDLGDHVGVDMSPQATAERIVDFATGFFEVWKQQNADSDKSDDELLDEFESTIRGAIDEGYGEAIEILRGMEEMTEGVFTTAEETYDLMQQLLDDRFAELRGDDEEDENGLVEDEEHVELSVPVYRDFNPPDQPEDAGGEAGAALIEGGESGTTTIDVLA